MLFLFEECVDLHSNIREDEKKTASAKIRCNLDPPLCQEAFFCLQSSSAFQSLRTAECKDFIRGDTRFLGVRQRMQVSRTELCCTTPGGPKSIRKSLFQSQVLTGVTTNEITSLEMFLFKLTISSVWISVWNKNLT